MKMNITIKKHGKCKADVTQSTTADHKIKQSVDFTTTTIQ